MRIKELRTQVEAVMASDLLEEAKIVWTFLIVCRSGGMGVRNLALRVGLDEETTQEAIDVLKEAGIVRRQRGVYKPLPYLRSTEEASTAPRALRDAARDLLEVYQKERTRAGGRRLIEPRGYMKNFEKLAEWLNAQGLDARDYIKWAADRAAFLQKKTGAVFVPPNVLAGDWLRGEWENGGGAQSAAPTSHAGKVYRDPAGLKSRLVAAGFDRARGFTKGDLRHIESWAMDMAALPDDFPTADPEFEREILWLKDHLSGGADVPSA